MWPGVDDTGYASNYDDDYVFYGYPTGNYIKQVSHNFLKLFLFSFYFIGMCNINFMDEFGQISN